MAHVEDRWYRLVDGEKVATPRKGTGRRWRARWIDPDGRERSESFDRKADAERRIAAVEGDKLRGTYVDLQAGRVRLRDFGTDWLAGQTFDDNTRQAVEIRLRRHVYPYLGDRQLGDLRPSHVQAWLKAVQQELAATTVKVTFSYLSSVLTAAVDDGRITGNPCKASSVKVPRPDARKVIPWTHAQVEAVRRALPARYQMAVALPAGCGLRQGETFGLALDDVDFLGRVVKVRRQVKWVGNQLVFALPKRRKTRDVPLPDALALGLSAYITQFPVVAVTLPWERPGGTPTTVRLLLTSRERKPNNRVYFNSRVWKPALVAAGLDPSRENGMHALRHWYASVLLDGGESIKVVSAYLGHMDEGFTLRTYTHLMPNTEDRARRVVDQALRRSQMADGPATAQDAT